MIQLHFGVKQLNIDKTMGVLYSFEWNHVTWKVFTGTVTYVKEEYFPSSIHNILYI